MNVPYVVMFTSRHARPGCPCRRFNTQWCRTYGCFDVGACHSASTCGPLLPHEQHRDGLQKSAHHAQLLPRPPQMRLRFRHQGAPTTDFGCRHRLRIPHPVCSKILSAYAAGRPSAQKSAAMHRRHTPPPCANCPSIGTIGRSAAVRTRSLRPVPPRQLDGVRPPGFDLLRRPAHRKQLHLRVHQTHSLYGPWSLHRRLLLGIFLILIALMNAPRYGRPSPRAGPTDTRSPGWPSGTRAYTRP